MARAIGSTQPPFSHALTERAPGHLPPTSNDPEWQKTLNDSLRRMAFIMSVVVIFIRFSMIHMVLAHELGTSFFLLYIFSIPALLGIILSGGLRRAFQGRPAWYWTGFLIWMGITVPFSIWRSGSAGLVASYARVEYPMLFVLAGAALSWRECTTVMRAIAWSAVVVIMTGRMFSHEIGGQRLGLAFGSIANPNDFAAHMILILPFLFWMGQSSKSIVVRLVAFCGVGYGIFQILLTASRGALIDLAVCVVFVFFRGAQRHRIALLILLPVVIALFVMVIPKSVVDRLSSFSASDADAQSEALQSSELRQYELTKSLTYTFQHPIFGVGPAEFAEYEGTHNQVIGTHGTYRDTHNTFTQISSECGIPGFLFFVAGIVSTLLLLNVVYRQAHQRPDCNDIALALLCIMVGMIGFCVAITFLTFGYFFYLPAMGGLAIAVATGAKVEMQDRASLPSPEVVPQWFVPAPVFKRTVR